MKKEELVLKNRFLELSRMAYQKGIPIFTDFLAMNELSILNNIKADELSTKYYMFGGYEFAERQMAVFVSDALFYEKHYPIATLNVKVKYPKFAQQLSHRDYLGALVHTGVDRCKIGDIIVKENQGYIFCHEKIAQFFCDELTQIKHTAVEVSVCDVPDELEKPNFTEIKGTVSSLRADSIVALAIKQSRNSTLELFRLQKIFINGRLTENTSSILKEDDILTVRGYGRFIFKEILGKTKKDRFYILLLKY